MLVYEEVSRNFAAHIILKASIYSLLILFGSCAHVRHSQTADAPGETRISKVCEGIYRGPRLDDLSELRRLKIRTILNLENNEGAIVKESALCRTLGIEVVNIRMSDISRPKPEDLIKAVKVMEDPLHKPVYVHCLHGQDRTGLVVAAYKIMHEGWSVARAYREAIDNGHKWWFYDILLGWKRSLEELSGGAVPVKEAAPLRTGAPLASLSVP